jgi:hypothetical protein
LVKQFFLTTLFYTTLPHWQEIEFVEQLIFLVLILSKPTLQLSPNDSYLIALASLMVFTCFKNCKNACSLNNLLNNYWQHSNTLEPINKIFFLMGTKLLEKFMGTILYLFSCFCRQFPQAQSEHGTSFYSSRAFKIFSILESHMWSQWGSWWGVCLLHWNSYLWCHVVHSRFNANHTCSHWHLRVKRCKNLIWFSLVFVVTPWSEFHVT